MKRAVFVTIGLLVLLTSQLFSYDVPDDIQTAFKNGQYDEAIQKIEVILKKDKLNADLYLFLGNCYQKKRDLAKSEEAYLRATSIRGNHFEALDSLGSLYLKANKLELAKSTFEGGLNKAKKDPEIAMFEDGLGLYYLAAKDFSNADLHFRKALIKDPASLKYNMHLGDVAYEQGSYAVAITSYTKVLEKDSLNAETHFRLAKSFLMQKRFGDALKSIDKTLALDSSYTEAYLIAGNIYTLYGATKQNEQQAQASLFSKAISLYNKYLGMTADSGLASYYRGKAYFALNDFENAVKDFESAMRAGFAKEDLLSLIGTSHSKLKQYQKAIDALSTYEKSIISANPDYAWTKEDAPLFFETGNAYSGLADSASRIIAGTYYDRALALDSTNAAYHYRAGQNLYFLKRYKEALDHYLKCMELSPDYAPAYLNAAYCYTSLQDWDNTIKYIDQALKMNPEYTSAYELMAKVFFQKKDYDSAVVYYEKSKQIDPKNCEPDRWIGLSYLVRPQPQASKAIEALLKYFDCKMRSGGSSCDDVEAVKLLAKAYQMKNDAKSAFEWVKKGLKCSPNDSELKKMFDDLELEVEE